MVERAIREMLSGVGVGENIVEASTYALHVRRRVSSQEHAAVGPAIDVRVPGPSPGAGGGGGVSEPSMSTCQVHGRYVGGRCPLCPNARGRAAILATDWLLKWGRRGSEPEAGYALVDAFVAVQSATYEDAARIADKYAADRLETRRQSSHCNRDWEEACADGASQVAQAIRERAKGAGA